MKFLLTDGGDALNKRAAAMGSNIIIGGGVEVHQDGLEVPFEINGDGSSLSSLDGIGGSAPLKVGIGTCDTFAGDMALLMMGFWFPTHKVNTALKEFFAGVLDD